MFAESKEVNLPAGDFILLLDLMHSGTKARKRDSNYVFKQMDELWRIIMEDTVGVGTANSCLK